MTFIIHYTHTDTHTQIFPWKEKTAKKKEKGEKEIEHEEDFLSN